MRAPKPGFLLILSLSSVFFCVQTKSAYAHEPLWGESPQTFAFGIWHPEFRFGFQNSSFLYQGSNRIPNPDAMRRTRLDGLFSLQYAPQTSLNIKIDIPFAQTLVSQNIGGQVKRTSATGLGNVRVSAKSRFYQKFGPDWKLHHSYVVGISLPTGAGGFNPDGSRLSPSDAPGSDKFGISLGYAFAYERLKDTLWFSAMFASDLGGTGSQGASFSADANYGYWIKRATKPQDLGLLLAAGVHYEAQDHDRIEGGGDPNSGYNLTGIAMSFIATKGQAQFRVGALVPVYQHVDGVQLRPEIQLRAGVEILL